MPTLFEVSAEINTLRKNQQHKEALEFFKRHHNEFSKKDLAGNEWIVSNVLSCLRKTGQLDAGFKFLEWLEYKVDKDSPALVRNTYVWLLYDKLKELKNGSPGTDSEWLFAKAKDILPYLDLKNVISYNAFSKVFFMVIEIETKIKNNTNWQFVDSFLDIATPENFSTECKTITVTEQGRDKDIEQASDREKWYSEKTKALQNLEKYEQCLRMSETALKSIQKYHYDNDLFFKRRIALCKGYLGQKDLAVEDLKNILSRRKEWYIQWEIATFYFELKKYDDALKYAVDAILNFGDLEKKWELVFLLGKILSAQVKTEDARKHVLFAYQIRTEKKWKIPQELQAEIEKLQIDTSGPLSCEQMHKELKGYWRSIKRTDSPKLRGKIKKILQNNIAGFICGENGKDYYFKFKDLHVKKEDIEIGLPVEFLAEKSYDKKKERESEQAIDVHILKG